MLDSMGRLDVYWNSPRVRLRNNVFLRNKIQHISVHARGSRIDGEEDLCLAERNIFTDNLTGKIHQPLNLSNARMRYNVFFIRPARDSGVPSDDLTFVTNPEFKGMAELEAEGEDNDGFPPRPINRQRRPGLPRSFRDQPRSYTARHRVAA